MKLSVTGALERDATVGGGGNVRPFCALDNLTPPISKTKTASGMTETFGTDRVLENLGWQARVVNLIMLLTQSDDGIWAIAAPNNV